MTTNATAQQESSIGGSGFSMTVSASGDFATPAPGAGNTDAAARATFSAVFAVTSAVAVSLTGDIDSLTNTNGTSPHGEPNRITVALLDQAGVNLITGIIQPKNGDIPVDWPGTLVPGTYEFQAFALVQDLRDLDFPGASAATSSSDLRLRFAVVPEPGCACLLGIGTLLFWRRIR